MKNENGSESPADDRQSNTEVVSAVLDEDTCARQCTRSVDVPEPVDPQTPDPISSDAISPITQLPSELLVEIFQLLPQADLLRHVPLVCRQWYEISLVPTLRTRLVLRKDVPPEALHHSFQTRPLLRVFRCPAMELAGPALVTAIRLPVSLQCIDIGFSNLTEECADSLSLNLPSTLIHLNVEGLKTVGLNFVSNLVCRCPRLEALNLSHCVGVCDQCVQLLAERLPGLRRLNLDGVLWLTDLALNYLVESDALCQGRLTAIWLDGFELSSTGVREFLRCMNTIQRNLGLRLSRGHNQIASSVTRSEDRSDWTTSKAEDGDDDAGDDDADVNQPQIGPHILWFSFCDPLTDDAIQPISGLSSLSALTLRKAQQITSGGWRSLFILDGLANSALQWLEHLDLSEAPAVNDSVVSALCACCGPRLRSLILNWCWELTDTALSEIVSTCSRLRHLSLVGNHLIQGHALIDIPSKQPQMSIVNLTQCNHVHDTVLEQLVQEMPHLYVFDYFGERVGGGPNDICHYDLWRSLEKVPICTD